VLTSQGSQVQSLPRPPFSRLQQHCALAGFSAGCFVFAVSLVNVSAAIRHATAATWRLRI
jgi:hypothetical protein